MKKNVVVRKNKKNRTFGKEKSYFIIILLILLAIPVCSVYTKAILSSSNIALEEIKSEIKEQESINEGLRMEISELASLDKIQTIAAENGLTYENSNIKVVTNE